MKEHPINEILKTSLENIGDIIDVNKVIGDPIVLPNNAIAIPISKVVCGYGVGGSQFKGKNKLFYWFKLGISSPFLITEYNSAFSII